VGWILGIHLLLVDVAMAGPLVCVWLEWRGTRRGDRVADQLGKSLARATNWALTLGIALGSLLLAARWAFGDQAYLDAVAVLPRSRLWFALAELLFSFACMGAYSALWDRWRDWRWPHRLLAIAAASNLLTHFPAIFTIISVITTRPELAEVPLDSAAYRRLLVDPEVLSHLVHVWLASLAVTGALVMALAVRLGRDETLSADTQRLTRSAAALTLAPTFVQIPVGLWLAMALPEVARRSVMGGDAWATGTFAVGVGLVLVLMQCLVGIALGDCGPKPVRRTVAIMVLVVVIMAETRSRAYDLAHEFISPAGSAAPRLSPSDADY
jgi:hypothetical protein